MGLCRNIKNKIKSNAMTAYKSFSITFNIKVYPTLIHKDIIATYKMTCIVAFIVDNLHVNLISFRYL